MSLADDPPRPGRDSQEAPAPTQEIDVGLSLSIGSLAPISKVQLYEQICNKILDQIRIGAWSSGQRLPPERELAAIFGVSRPSLREALGALQMLGVVETKHGSGSWVTKDALEILSQQRAADMPDFGVSPVAVLEARASIDR